MQTSLFPSPPVSLDHLSGGRVADEGAPTNALAWSSLPLAARVYVTGVITGGAFLMVKFFPTTIPDAVSLAALIALSCLTSAWKVNLPLHPSSGSTLSVSCAAD